MEDSGAKGVEDEDEDDNDETQDDDRDDDDAADASSSSSSDAPVASAPAAPVQQAPLPPPQPAAPAPVIPPPIHSRAHTHWGRKGFWPNSRALIARFRFNGPRPTDIDLDPLLQAIGIHDTNPDFRLLRKKLKKTLYDRKQRLGY